MATPSFAPNTGFSGPSANQAAAAQQPTNIAAGIISSPFVDPVAYMSVTVSGMTIGPKDGTGKVSLQRAGRPYKWQTKDASGQDGNTKTYKGKKSPDFELIFWLWTDAHFAAWQQMANTSFIYDASKTTVDPVDVYRPELAMVGISQMIVDECGAPEQVGEGTLMWKAVVKCSEYFPPILVNVTQTPPGATNADPTAPGTTPDPALTQLQGQIAAATQQAIIDGVLSSGNSPQGSGLP